MAESYQQTDSAGACAVGTDLNRTMVKDGTAGVTPVSITITKAATEKAVAFEAVPGAGVTWDAGSHTVRINVSTGNGNVTITAIYLYRYSSACGLLEELGSATGLSLAASGVVTQAVTGAAGTTPADTDKYIVAFDLTNGHAHSDQSVSITPDQLIDAPFTAGSTPVSNTAAAAYEWAQPVTQGGPAELEWLAPVSLEEAAAFELLAPVAVSRIAPLEWTQPVTSDRATALEWLATVLLARAEPWEATSPVTGMRALLWESEASPSKIKQRLEVTLDAGAATYLSGGRKRRSLKIPAAEYPTPFWIRFDDDSVTAHRVDALPYRCVREFGRLEILSAAP